MVEKKSDRYNEKVRNKSENKIDSHTVSIASMIEEIKRRNNKSIKLILF
ncbi:MAG TPA: hypothetical protein VFK40_06085 [Nitrososphaeraceae archaeon]|nr:hypothetical protein [Nitrososphaeraceae archaeon]